MTKEQQDKAWNSLPIEAQEEIKRAYTEIYYYKSVLGSIFGHANIIGKDNPYINPKTTTEKPKHLGSC